MNIVALHIVQKIILLEKFLNMQNTQFFIDAISDLIDESSNGLEKQNFNSALIKFEAGDNKEVLEILGSMRVGIAKTLFNSPCDKNWSSLIPTNDDGVKFCSECNRNVFKVFSKDDYRKRKKLNQCVAINFNQLEKVSDGIGCEMSSAEQFELLGDPSTFDE